MKCEPSPGAVHVLTLPLPERLFLWAVRTWSAHHDDVSVIWWSLDSAFARERIHAALLPFDSFMSAVFDGLRHWPDIRCVRCATLGAQEIQLLDLLGHLQRQNELGARAALQDWVLRPAMRLACEHAAACARIAAEAGLKFSAPPRLPAVVAANVAAAARESTTQVH